MIIVVGGRGVIGGGIVDALKAEGRELEIVTHDGKQAARPGFRYGNMRDPETLDATMAGAEIVVQSAMFSTYPVEKPRKGHTFMAFDGEGTENLVAAAAKAGVKRYIYIGGAGCKPNSPQPYFKAIYRGEQAVLDSSMESVVISPTLVYGPRDRGLNVVVSVSRKLPFLPIVGNGGSMEQPVAVQDVGKVVAQAAHVGGPAGKYEIGGPDRMTLKDTIRHVFDVVGLKRPLVHVPKWMALFGASILQYFPGTPLTVNAVHFITEDFISDNEPLLATFDMELTSFDEGIRRYMGPGKTAG